MSFSLFSWLKKQETSAEKLVEHYADIFKKDAALVMPIVAEVSSFVGDLGAQTQDQVLAKAKTYIETATKDSNLAQSFVDQHKGSLIPSIMHYLAVTVATFSHSALIAKGATYLDSIVQVAYGAAKSGAQAA